ARHRRPAARPGGPAARLPLRPPLRPRAGPLPAGRPSARRRHGPGPPVRVLVPGGGVLMAGTGTAHLRDGALLRVEDLVVEYPLSGARRLQAVSGISLDVAEGETLGLVGESGCGKSTTGRAIMQLPRPTNGRVLF